MSIIMAHADNISASWLFGATARRCRDEIHVSDQPVGACQSIETGDGRLFRGLKFERLSRQLIEMGFDLIEMHDVDILVLKVEQIDFVNQLLAIVCALLNDRHVKSVRIGIHRAGADAA